MLRNRVGTRRLGPNFLKTMVIFLFSRKDPVVLYDKFTLQLSNSTVIRRSRTMFGSSYSVLDMKFL